MKKHWKVLKGDRILGPVLPNKPNAVYRRKQTLKDMLAPSAIDFPPKIIMFGNFFLAKSVRYVRLSKLLGLLP